MKGFVTSRESFVHKQVAMPLAFLACVLCVAGAVLSLPQLQAVAYAETGEESPFAMRATGAFPMLAPQEEGVIEGACGENLIWAFNSETGELAVSGEGDMDVWKIASAVPWNAYRQSIKSVAIDAGVTSIGGYAFQNCTALEEVTFKGESRLGASETDAFGVKAFDGCENLKRVNSTSKVAYVHFKGLNEGAIEQPVPVYEAQHLKYAYDENMQGVWILGWDKVASNITVPSAITVTISGAQTPLPVVGIAEGAFLNQTALRDISFEDVSQLKTIENAAFKGCATLCAMPKKFKVPATVESIGDEAFSDCYELYEVEFADDSQLTSIGAKAFFNCQKLGNPESNKPLQIPSTVASIGEYAFSGKSPFAGVNTVTFPNRSALTEVERYQFHGCQHVELGEGTQTIGANAFANCTTLVSVSLPTTITSIGNSAFNGCNKLEALQVPAAVTSIGDSAFAGCSSLATIAFNLPSELASIGSSAFRGCSKLTELSLVNNSNLASIGASAFEGCTKLAKAELPEGLTALSSRVFYGCAALAELRVPKEVTSIGAGAFYRCRALASVIMPNPSKIATIGESAFEGCTALASMDIPVSVSKIEKKAFSACTALAAVDFHVPSVEAGDASEQAAMPVLDSIGESAFEGCTSLAGVELPASVTSIGYYAFRNCSALEVVKVNSENAWLGYQCFMGIANPSSIYAVSDTMIDQLINNDGFIDKATTGAIEVGGTKHDISENNTKDTIVIAVEDTVYSADGVVMPKVTVTFNGQVLREGTETEGVASENGDYVLSNEAAPKAGEATVVVKGINDYCGFARKTYTVNQASVPVPVPASGLKYNGAAQVGVAASESGLYKVTGGSATKAGTYTATVSLTDKENYKWADGTIEDQMVEWAIAQVGVVVTPVNATKAYGENDPRLTATLVAKSPEDQELVDKEARTIKYTLEREAGEDVRDYVITAAGEASQGNYAVEFGTGTFSIQKRDLAGATVSLSKSSYVYSGQAAEPGVTVKVGNKTLTANTDYEVTYANNVGVSTDALPAKVLVTGKGNYVGAAEKSFTISKATVTVTPANVTKGYGDPDPVLTATVTGALPGDESAIAYSLSREEGESVGSYAIIATGEESQGNYAVKFATASKLTISKKTLTADMISLDEAQFTYNGEAVKPAVTVVANGTTLEEGTDYSVGYTNNVNASDTAPRVTVRGVGNFTGTVNVAFTIAQAAATVTPDNASKTFGATDPKLTATVTGVLAEDKNRVRYTLTRELGESVGSYAITATGAASQGNYVVTYGAPATFTIGRSDFSTAAISLSQSHYTYDGKAAKPNVTVRHNGKTLVAGIDYRLSYQNNVNAGEAQAVVVGVGNYEGTAVKSFTIAQAPVMVTPVTKTKVFGAKDPVLKATVTGTVGKDKVKYKLSREKGSKVGSYAITAKGAASQGNYAVSFGTARFTITQRSIAKASVKLTEKVYPYTGTSVMPKPVVKVNGKKIKAGSAYTVSYSNNVNLGKATLTITGIGNYTGTKARTFKIAGLPKGKTAEVAGATYKVRSATTVYYKKAPADKKKVKVPATVKLMGKRYKVVGISSKAFKGASATTVTVKTNQLVAKSVKSCFKGWKVKTVKVPKAKKAAYKKIFVKKNSGKKVKVK